MFDTLTPFARTTLALFGGVFGVLVFASTVGALLKWKVARGAPHGVIDNLNARVNAWWIMVATIDADLSATLLIAYYARIYWAAGIFHLVF